MQIIGGSAKHGDTCRSLNRAFLTKFQPQIRAFSLDRNTKLSVGVRQGNSNRCTSCIPIKLEGDPLTLSIAF